MADHDRTASLMTPATLAAQGAPSAAVSPAAWLNQMAADAGYAHVRRLGELREEMQKQAGLRDFSPVTAELTRLAEALPQLDFGLLQARGWWARTTGKSRTAGAEFRAWPSRCRLCKRSCRRRGQQASCRWSSSRSNTAPSKKS
jgi:hypothetical protein